MTVLCVVPYSSAAPRYEPTLSCAAIISRRFLGFITIGPLARAVTVSRRHRRGRAQRPRATNQVRAAFVATGGDLHGHPLGPQLATSSGGLSMATDTGRGRNLLKHVDSVTPWQGALVTESVTAHSSANVSTVKPEHGRHGVGSMTGRARRRSRALWGRSSGRVTAEGTPNQSRGGWRATPSTG